MKTLEKTKSVTFCCSEMFRP